MQRAGVATEHRSARTKPEIALAEIDRVIAAGVRFGCVLADAGYGMSAPFRQELTRRKLTWAVGIPRHLKVYPVGVRLIFPTARRGRPRQRSIPDVLSVPAEDMLADARWQNIGWRTGTKGKLNGEAGKKESTDHHRSQACPPSATRSSISSFDRSGNARTADDGSVRDCGVSEFCQSSASN